MNVRLIATAIIFGVIGAAAYKHAHSAESPQYVEVPQYVTPTLVIERNGDELLRLTLYNEGEKVAVINPDGSVDLFRGDATDAAKTFWKVIASQLVKCNKEPKP